MYIISESEGVIENMRCTQHILIKFSAPNEKLIETTPIYYEQLRDIRGNIMNT